MVVSDLVHEARKKGIRDFGLTDHVHTPYNHADIALSTALHHSPSVSVWWGRLGYAREMAKDYVYALEAYEMALSLNPNLSDAERGRSRVHSAMQATSE